ncbi:GNAT family N-acetyltransferase [Fictibacillus barbaricus]|uniref:Ribosomal protein S18 acetylase RimI-like enzyme n=1 Tax=Fictibacillus barbaricus TaxID=182136 RepID=A0ABU1U4M7_9BACL|nr:GNAT family N-acetyltransferase [Fictibacillus barbaricus]MDR7074417.1 ribosomal protein S18 acetylase RimI-like enzyme [Fictibacillus barbaricus]
MERILKAEVSDASEILSLQKLAYLSEAELYGNYEIEPLKQTVQDIEKAFETNFILKCVDNGMIVGSVKAYEKDGTCYIGKLMVHPDYQNKGIGKKLMNEIERKYEHVRYELFTGSKSIKNITFYERLGYKGFSEKKLDREETIFIFMEKQAEVRT